MANHITKNGKAIIKAGLKSSQVFILAKKNRWVYFTNGFYVIRMFDLTFAAFAKIIGFDGELNDDQYYRYVTDIKKWGITDNDGKWIEIADTALDKAYLRACLLPWVKSENIDAPQCRFFFNNNNEEIGLIFAMFDENYCDIMDDTVKYLFPKDVYSMLVARTYLGEGVAVMPVQMSKRTRKTVECIINEHLKPEEDD